MRAPKGWGFLLGARRSKASGGGAIGILIVLGLIYSACSRMFEGCGTAMSCAPAPPPVDPAEVERLKAEGNAKIEEERIESAARAHAEAEAARAATIAKIETAPPPAKAETSRKHGQPKVLAAPASKTCCKHCNKGKPCGDTCIARNKACYAGPGCAC